MKYITCIILISFIHVLLIFVVNTFVCACVQRRAHTWRSSWSTRDSSAEFFSFNSVFKDSSIDARSVTLMWSCLRSKIISCRRLPSATVVTSGNCRGGKEMVPYNQLNTCHVLLEETVSNSSKTSWFCPPNYYFFKPSPCFSEKRIVAQLGKKALHVFPQCFFRQPRDFRISGKTQAKIDVLEPV